MGEILKIYRSAYRNWPSVLLGLALRGRARAVTRDGRVVEGDDIILGAIARLYASDLGDRAVRRFWQQWELSREGNQEATAYVSKIFAAAATLHVIKGKYGPRCCRLIEVSDDLSYAIAEIGKRRALLYEWYRIRFTDLDDYGILNVEGKLVLDIGAFVGDSAMLFALRGARRVVAVEPSPWAFNVAMRNVKANGLSDTVELINCAVMREEGKTLTLPSSEIGADFRVSVTKGGVPVPICTLDSLIERFGPFDVLKMDCEGCEYESIPYSRRIGEVKEVLIEYHEGYEVIVRKLLEAGFRMVRFSRPGERGKLHSRPVDLRQGYIYAVK